MDDVWRSRRIDHGNPLRTPLSFRTKAIAHPRVKIRAAALHAIGLDLPPRDGDVIGQIENEGQIRLQPARRQPSHGPQLVRIEAAGVALEKIKKKEK